MSKKEQITMMLESVPEYKLDYIIAYVEALMTDEQPNAETIEAMREMDNGGGTLYTGSTTDIFAALDREVEDDA